MITIFNRHCNVLEVKRSNLIIKCNLFLTLWLSNILKHLISELLCTLSNITLDSLFIEEIKGLGLLRGELGEGATPLHHAGFYAGLGLHLLYSRGTGGGAKQSAEAAGGDVTESQEGQRANKKGKSKVGVTNQPDNQGSPSTTNIYCTVT